MNHIKGFLTEQAQDNVIEGADSKDGSTIAGNQSNNTQQIASPKVTVM